MKYNRLDHKQQVDAFKSLLQGNWLAFYGIRGKFNDPEFDPDGERTYIELVVRTDTLEDAFVFSTEPHELDDGQELFLLSLAAIDFNKWKIESEKYGSDWGENWRPVDIRSRIAKSGAGHILHPPRAFRLYSSSKLDRLTVGNTKRALGNSLAVEFYSTYRDNTNQKVAISGSDEGLPDMLLSIGNEQCEEVLIPIPVIHDRCAQSRMPMDMMVQG
jgi:hypothetical protein